MPSLKDTARHIFTRTLSAIDIAATFERKLARSGSHITVADATLDLAAANRIVVIAVGKAAHPMTAGLLRVLAPDFRAEGIISAPTPLPAPLPGFESFLAGHPVPNPASFAAARAALELLRTCDDRTLIFFLLSGGGSALMELPLDPAATLEDTQTLNRVLVGCGAPIAEINAVRKHLSAVKGGRLAAAAPAATKVTLGVTDVPAGQETALASGPTLPDPTTVADALSIIERYSIADKLPASIRALIASRSLIETPKSGHPAFARAHFQILLGLHDLFHAAHCAAESAGFITICDNSTDDWRLDSASDYLLERLASLTAQHPGWPVCVIADGEVLSPVTGNGIGGRNSAFVLNCLEKISGKGIAVLSAGTDGIDGNSPAAGAVADGDSLARARAANLDPADYFRRSDAFTFFDSLTDAVITGPTANNLRDLRILLRK